MTTNVYYDKSKIHIFLINNVIETVFYPWDIIHKDIRFVIIVMGRFKEIKLHNGVKITHVDSAKVYRGCGTYEKIKLKLTIIHNFEIPNEKLLHHD